MNFQVGKGPWASEVSGIVKIGQTMTMVLGIKGSELARLIVNQFMKIRAITCEGALWLVGSRNL